MLLLLINKIWFKLHQNQTRAHRPCHNWLSQKLIIWIRYNLTWKWIMIIKIIRRNFFKKWKQICLMLLMTFWCNQWILNQTLSKWKRFQIGWHQFLGRFHWFRDCRKDLMSCKVLILLWMEFLIKWMMSLITQILEICKLNNNNGSTLVTKA